MNMDDEILLNQLAQGLRVSGDGISWFRSLENEYQVAVLRYLAFVLLQAGATEEDVTAAIERSNLRPSYTPCALLSKGRLKEQLAKVCSLPPAEHEKAFRLLLALFSIADDRRRVTRCRGICSHWWHRDLADDEVLRELRSKPDSPEG